MYNMYSTVPAIKIASAMLDTGVFQFAALKGEMDKDTWNFTTGSLLSYLIRKN